MKLNDRHIAGLIRNKEAQKQVIDCQKKLSFDMTGINHDEIIERTYSNIFKSPSKSFILRKTTFNVIDRIKLNGSFDVRVFNRLPNETIEIIISERELYRCYYDGNRLYSVLINIDYYVENNPYITYKAFSIDPTTGIKSWNYDTVQSIAERFFRMLVFLYFSDIKRVVVNPNQKIGTISTGTYKNELKNPFIIVDSMWNNIVVRNIGFTVSGHFRLQPCGKGLSDLKLIFIDEFQKEGYVRGAKKELVLNN